MNVRSWFRRLRQLFSRRNPNQSLTEALLRDENLLEQREASIRIADAAVKDSFRKLPYTKSGVQTCPECGSTSLQREYHWKWEYCGYDENRVDIPREERPRFIVASSIMHSYIRRICRFCGKEHFYRDRTCSIRPYDKKVVSESIN